MATELKRKRQVVEGESGGGGLGALPSDFFDQQSAGPKGRQSVVVDGEERRAGANPIKKSVAESSKKEVAFDAFFNDIKADIVEIEKKEEEEDSKEGGENTLQQEENFEQLVNQGRAAVWRKLAEDKKREASLKKTEEEEAREVAKEEEIVDDDDDSGDDDALFDWRSKGI